MESLTCRRSGGTPLVERTKTAQGELMGVQSMDETLMLHQYLTPPPALSAWVSSQLWDIRRINQCSFLQVSEERKTKTAESWITNTGASALQCTIVRCANFDMARPFCSYRKWQLFLTTVSSSSSSSTTTVLMVTCTHKVKTIKTAVAWSTVAS